jgi:DUF971 family protein
MTCPSSSQGAPSWPVEVRLLQKGTLLEIEFEDGMTGSLPAELLRVESPSAEVQGHGSGRKKILPRCPEVTIVKIDPVGNYALRLHFSDGHNTGLYTWRYLYELGARKDHVWETYLSLLNS